MSNVSREACGETAMSPETRSVFAGLPEFYNKLTPDQSFWLKLRSVVEPVFVTHVHGDELKANVLGDQLRNYIQAQYINPTRGMGLYRLNIISANPLAAALERRGVEQNILFAYNSLARIAREYIAGNRSQLHLNAAEVFDAYDPAVIEAEQAMSTLSPQYLDAEYRSHASAITKLGLSYDALRAHLVRQRLLEIRQYAYEDFLYDYEAWLQNKDATAEPDMRTPVVIEIHASGSNRPVIVIPGDLNCYAVHLANRVADVIEGDVPIALYPKGYKSPFDMGGLWMQVEIPATQLNDRTHASRTLESVATWSDIAFGLRRKKLSSMSAMGLGQIQALYCLDGVSEETDASGIARSGEKIRKYSQQELEHFTPGFVVRNVQDPNIAEVFVPDRWPLTALVNQYASLL